MRRAGEEGGREGERERGREGERERGREGERERERDGERERLFVHTRRGAHGQRSVHRAGIHKFRTDTPYRTHLT